ncbi:MAG: response regulator [Firmicutes bacterium HGW-Firmicutes-12]|jgi:response regulator NasT|nr:MAG: response regulator [Firmicutes bacterium HGW-Firmicutes-12]
MITVMVFCTDTKRRNKITSLIQTMGMTVVAEASDGPQALRLIRSSMPHLVIIDVEKYDYNEMETASIIAKEKIAPIILVTYPYQQNILDAITEEYVMSYLIKPLNKWALESAVHTALASFRKMENKELEINKLKDTLETRKLVEKAKYIVMRDYKLSETDAFRLIQKQSMDRGMPMKNIADAILLNDEMKRSK